MSDEEILQKCKKNFGKKICIEKPLEYFLTDFEKKIYKKEQCSCCGQKGILTCSIIFLILNCAGIFFAISRNEGYKALKLALTNNITSISQNFPDESESLRLVNALQANHPKYNTYSCSYQRFHNGECLYSEYKGYCNNTLHSSGECNDMDNMIYNNLTDLTYCTEDNYNAGHCNTMQREDYEKFYSKDLVYDIPNTIRFEKKEYSSSLEIYYLRGFSIQIFWSEIGKYDVKILGTSLAFIFLFIIFLIFDIYYNKSLSIGIKYYITVVCYMFFYVVLRICSVLYLYLLIYSIIVFVLNPVTYVKNELPKTNDYIEHNFNTIGIVEYFFKPVKDDDEGTRLWKEKRIYAMIYIVINLLLVIFCFIISSLRKIIYSFLTFNNNNIKEKTKKINIHVGNNSYEIEMFQERNLFLIENETQKKYEFRKIIYNNKEYYLKVNNRSLYDQVGWTEFGNDPKINEGLSNLLNLFTISCILIFDTIILQKFEITNEYIYKYICHLIELGYHPRFYSYYNNFGDLSTKLNNLLFIIYIIIAILLMIPVVKRIVFDGFSNIFLSLVTFIISIIFSIISLGFIIFCVYMVLCSVFTFILQIENKANFSDDFIPFKEYCLMIFYLFSLVVLIINSIKTINLSKYLYSVIVDDNMILCHEKSRLENKFRFLGLSNQNVLIEVDNSENCPGGLLYRQINDELDTYIKEAFNESSSKILGLELNKEELLNESEQDELCAYLNKNFYLKGLFGNIVYLIIIGIFTFAFMIAALSTLIKNNLYYQNYRNYILSQEKTLYDGIYASYGNALFSNISSFAKFWCDLANVEVGVLVSYFIFLIMFLVIEILSLLFIKRKITIFDIKNGLFNLIIILINGIFYVLFLIYIPLFLYLFIYSVLVTVLSPFQIKEGKANGKIFYDPNDDGSDDNSDDSLDNPFEKMWILKNKIVPFVNCVIILILFFLDIALCNIKYVIIRYIKKDFEEENNENIEEQEKELSIIFNNNKHNVKIKEKTLYIKQIYTEKIHKFKKISIDGITNNENIYLKIENNSITDQISQSEWDYPILNDTFNQLAFLSKHLYAIYFLSIPLFTLDVFKEKNYQINFILNIKNTLGIGINNEKEKKILYSGIFSNFGAYETGNNKSRLVLDTIYIVFLLLNMLFKVYYGGFSQQKYNKIIFYISLYFILQNATNLILTFLSVLFNALSIVSYYDGFYFMKDEIIQTKIIAYVFFLFPIFAIHLSLFINSLLFSLHFNTIRKELENPISGLEELKYIKLNGDINTLKHYINDNLPRYLFYIASPENNQKEIEYNNLNMINNNNDNNDNDNIKNKQIKIENEEEKMEKTDDELVQKP